MSLREDIEHAINCNSAENASNTPDFILCEFLLRCLCAFDKSVNDREQWYGRDPSMGPGKITTDRRPIIYDNPTVSSSEEQPQSSSDVTINRAEAGDIYIDPFEKLWRINTVYQEPTIIAEEVEGTLHDPNIRLVGVTEPRPASIVKERLTVPINNFILKGWTRIWRRQPNT